MLVLYFITHFPRLIPVVTVYFTLSLIQVFSLTSDPNSGLGSVAVDQLVSTFSSDPSLIAFAQLCCDPSWNNRQVSSSPIFKILLVIIKQFALLNIRDVKILYVKSINFFPSL